MRLFPSRILLRSFVLVPFVGALVLAVAWRNGNVTEAHAGPHSEEELEEFRSAGLVVGENQYFKASGNCDGCHGHDPGGVASVTESGVDVNVVDDWRSSMMANSARDPFWKAKVSHEVLVNPGHQAGLEDKCTSCHAPMGRHDKHMLGQGPYSMAELEQDPMGQDGVSCVGCHIQSADSLGQIFSGSMKFDTLDRPLYGPYDDMFFPPMQSFVGYTPQYGAHVNDAGFCAGCHTLATETADLNGDPTGQVFFEQATYHEWLNSVFNNNENPDGITCQGCHVPRIDEGAILSANYLFLTAKSPWGLHHFAGANTFMLKMLKDHSDALGLTAEAYQFDSTIARTERLLSQHSVFVDATVAFRDADTAFINVKLSNLAGHKFPSGYPSRRAWVEVEVTDANGQSLYHNGTWDNGYEVIGHDADWEPHYNVITAADQVQIYEMVMADVNGDKTTVLERAATKLKDNRLAPEGFTTQHNTYDTSTVANVPASDTDFNFNELNVEGSGSDIVHYHIPMAGYTGLIHVHARVWYQSSPPKWMEEMFAYNSAPIDSFRTYFEAADNTPFLVQEDSLTDMSVGIDDLEELGVRVFPNPVKDGMLTVMGLSPAVLGIEVYDAKGRIVLSHIPRVTATWRAQLPEGAGTYFIHIRMKDRSFVERVVAL